MPRADIKRGALSPCCCCCCCFYCCCGCYYPVWQTLEQLDNVFGFRLCVWQETEIIVGRTHVSMPSGPRGNTNSKNRIKQPGRRHASLPRQSPRPATGNGKRRRRLCCRHSFNANELKFVKLRPVDAAYAQFNCCEICRMSMSSAIVVATAAPPQRQRCFSLVAVRLPENSTHTPTKWGRDFPQCIFAD